LFVERAREGDSVAVVYRVRGDARQKGLDSSSRAIEKMLSTRKGGCDEEKVRSG
jgi:hypothetical protein